MEAMTPKDRLNAAQHEITRILRQADIKISEYTEQMQTDYRNFFHWHAAKMYETQEIHEYFSMMPGVEEYDDITAFADAIKNRIKNIEDELIRRSAFGNCTDEIVNVEHRIILESKRQIRELLLGILWTLKED